MKIIAVLITVLSLFTACGSSENTSANNTQTNDHKITVTEVINTTEYTYLKVKENDKEFWMAVPKMEAKVGDVYYYDGGFEMTNFQSKELNRTFESVLFLEGVSKDPIVKGNNTNTNPNNSVTNPHEQMTENPHGNQNSKTQTEKVSEKIDPVQGGISIAELFKNKDKYNGKSVKIKGKIVKANYEIMKTNWYHIQDGTDSEGNFDLTVTSPNMELKVDQVVTFEGKISLKKDFGYGYSYEVIMEDAVVK